MIPPGSQIGPITPEQRQALIKGLLVAGVYEKTVDRDSAYEKLKGRAQASAGAAPDATPSATVPPTGSASLPGGPSAAADAKRPVERLQIRDLTAERVIAFLNHLEAGRGNGIATRKARLGAIHVFARFLAGRRPEVLGTLQQVIALPYKRGAREAPISFLERAEIEAVLQSIDRGTALGRRDYVLFALMFNTGARVQEALDLRRRDVRLEAPPQVRLRGKGNKVRLCPIWPVTAKLLDAYFQELPPAAGDPADVLLFTNARGRPLTRFGVRYLLRRYVPAAAKQAPGMRDKSIHPHSLRHSTAIALLKAGVDFTTISQWLGHAGLNTTMRYARADIDLKRQAIAQVFPDALAPPRGGRFQPDGRDLVGWLRRM